MHVIKNAVPDYLKWRSSFPSAVNKVEACQKNVCETKGSVCMTGFRDAALNTRLEAAGYTVSDSLTKATKALFVLDLSKNSGKIESAKKYGIKIISRENADSFFL
jgi:NAD-dependent DNA ligase